MKKQKDMGKPGKYQKKQVKLKENGKKLENMGNSENIQEQLGKNGKSWEKMGKIEKR